MTVRVLTAAASPTGRDRGQRAIFEALQAVWTGSLSQSTSALAVVDPTWPTRGLVAAMTARFEPAGSAGTGLVTFSSGTSGRPRGICRRMDSWTRVLPAYDARLGLDRLGAGSWWIPGPLWGSLSLFAAYDAVRLGRPVVLAEEDASDAVAAHCVPAVLPRITAAKLAGDLPRLDTVVVAGDRLPGPWWGDARSAGLRVVEFYGSAELTICAVRDDPAGPLRAVPGVDFQVRDGVVWVRTPYLTEGYLEADRGGPLRVDGHGWATVGDRARWFLPEDPGAGIEVLGRADDGVTVGGHTVVTGDIEEALRTLPGVRDVAVVGLPHRLLGAQVGAMVVTDREVSELRDAARARLSSPSRPRRWVAAEAIPRTSAGKVDRTAVRSAVTAVTGRAAECR